MPIRAAIAHNPRVTFDTDDDRREHRKRQILAVAKEVFAELGYHHASINEIITRANIARGTFYLYFSNKHKVFDAILGEALRELRARITRIQVDRPGTEPPQVQLRENLVRVMDYVLSDQPLTRILLDHRQSALSEVAERVDEFFADVAALIESSLQYGIVARLVRPCNTALTAAALLGAARGMVEFCLRAETPPPVTEIVDEFMAVTLRGVFGGHELSRSDSSH